MSHLSPVERPLSRVSLTPSDTTYHSFHDVELYEPEAVQPPRPKPSVLQSPVTILPASKNHGRSISQEMRRQDSGYESMVPRDSLSSSSRNRRMSAASVTSSTHRQRTRPSAHRPTRSGPVSYLPRKHRQSISPQRCYSSRRSESQQPVTFFHFPHFTTSEPVLDETEMTDNARGTQAYGDVPLASYAADAETPAYPLPPQTTHYWTSDRTRRLEYAAIDAARKGVRGWVMRHIVPDCFVPKSKRRVGFEDDRGSVVRYRLDLDVDDGPEKSGHGRKDWWLSMRGR
ncbi:hypothetical protein B0H63DRAFT_451235 [Podospora didyma]|uniref:Uncharacterized protein n=1 Tax=Podospora didyma TaxID=330526 RepID=A0AAE0NI36_9PEZI|nr:hypothetical protein B0H63DRAFT_451235 [Podospora didyma]